MRRILKGMAVLLRVALPAAVLLVSGCGGETIPEAQPVTGVVTLEGAPVEGADVVLVPSDQNTKSAGAMTDAQGNFSVKTYWDREHQLDGALRGEYGITITKMEKPDVPANMKPEEVMALYSNSGPPKSLLPKRYSTPSTSGFKVSVGDSPPDPLQLELKKEE